jgi:solute carrier family 39 (zinc transporter), member 1/2/3
MSWRVSALTITDGSSLLDPAYEELGPATCVGMTGGWASYSWPPAIALVSSMVVFLMDFAAERFVEKKYGLAHDTASTDATAVMQRNGSVDAAMLRYSISHAPLQVASAHHNHQHLHSGEQDGTLTAPDQRATSKDLEASGSGDTEANSLESEKERMVDTAFQQQIAAFLILEFGVIFHSV